jgi:hypothetical protein
LEQQKQGIEIMSQINIKLTSEQIQAIGKAVATPKPKRKAKIKTGLTLAQYLDLIGFNPDHGMRAHLGHMLTRYAKARGLHVGKYGPANVYPVSVLRDFVKD